MITRLERNRPNGSYSGEMGIMTFPDLSTIVSHSQKPERRERYNRMCQVI